MLQKSLLLFRVGLALIAVNVLRRQLTDLDRRQRLLAATSRPLELGLELADHFETSLLFLLAHRLVLLGLGALGQPGTFDRRPSSSSSGGGGGGLRLLLLLRLQVGESLYD